MWPTEDQSWAAWGPITPEDTNDLLGREVSLPGKTFEQCPLPLLCARASPVPWHDGLSLSKVSK